MAFQPDLKDLGLGNPSIRSIEARKVLQQLGFAFRLGTFHDIYRITSRDTEGGSYPYNAAFSSPNLTREDWIIELGGIEIGYYYKGLEKAGERIEGEIGMIHLAPGLRNRRLSSLFRLLGYIQLIEEGAEEIRSVVGDDSGKIIKLLIELGFHDTGQTKGILRHPVWRLSIDDKNAALEKLLEIFYQRAERITPDRLEFDPLKVDVDNPQRVSIEATVLERLSQKGCLFSGDERLLFGYPCAPVCIYQQNLVNNRTQLVLRIEARAVENKKTLQNIMKKHQLGNLEIYDESFTYPTWEIVSSGLETEVDVQKFALKFAQIAWEFYSQVTKTY